MDARPALAGAGAPGGALPPARHGAGRRPPPLALGRVSLWGRVFENTDGWRAQFAYPYELFVLGGGGGTVRALRDAYAVDVLSLS